MAPELGIVLPGATHAVPDSHASTVGGVGALAFGCGTSEMTHILATQVMALKRPKRMRARLDGRLGAHVSAKDVALRLIAELGVAGGRGYVVEYAGSAVRAMPIEQRMTLCNLNIEMGGRSGFVAPDDATFSWLAGRPYAAARRDVGSRAGTLALARRPTTMPNSIAKSRSTAARLSRKSPGAPIRARSSAFPAACPNRRRWIRAGAPPRKVRSPIWACNPARRSPGFPSIASSSARAPTAGCPISKSPPPWCAAGTLPKASSAMVVPGSSTVKREAEAAGLDRVFRDAGFFWGESGCSMCAGGNGDRGEPGERCVSTTNRNFENRQGPKVRTHLASPATAAATAIAGRIADVRQLLSGAA